MTPADTDALRSRLLALQADVMRQLAAALPIVDLGLLRVAADAGAVLAMLDDEADL